MQRIERIHPATDRAHWRRLDLQHQQAEQRRDSDCANLAVLDWRQIPEHSQQCAVGQQCDQAGADGEYLGVVSENGK